MNIVNQVGYVSKYCIIIICNTKLYNSGENPNLCKEMENKEKGDVGKYWEREKEREREREVSVKLWDSETLFSFFFFFSFFLCSFLSLPTCKLSLEQWMCLSACMSHIIYFVKFRWKVKMTLTCRCRRVYQSDCVLKLTFYI